MKKTISALLLAFWVGLAGIGVLSASIGTAQAQSGEGMTSPDGAQPSEAAPSADATAERAQRDTNALIAHIEARDNGIVAAGDIQFNKLESSSGYLVNGKAQVTISCVWYTRQKLKYELGEADPGVGAWRNGEIYGGKYVASVIKNADLGMGGRTSPEKFMARLGEPGEDAMIVLYLGGHTVLIDAIIDGNVYYTDNWPASDFHYGVTEKLEVTVEPLSKYLSRPNKKIIQSAVVLTPI